MAKHSVINFSMFLQEKAKPSGRRKEKEQEHLDICVLGNKEQLKDIILVFTSNGKKLFISDRFEVAKWYWVLKRAKYVILQDDYFDDHYRKELHSLPFIGECAMRSIIQSPLKDFRWNERILRSVELENESFLIVPSKEREKQEKVMELLLEHSAIVTTNMRDSKTHSFLVMASPPIRESISQAINKLAEYKGALLGKKFCENFPAEGKPTRKWIESMYGKPFEHFTFFFSRVNDNGDLPVELGGQVSMELTEANIVIGKTLPSLDEQLSIDLSKQIFATEAWYSEVTMSKQVKSLPEVSMLPKTRPHKWEMYCHLVRANVDLSDNGQSVEAEQLIQRLKWKKTDDLLSSHVSIVDCVISRPLSRMRYHITLSCLRAIAEGSHKEACWSPLHIPTLITENHANGLNGRKFMVIMQPDRAEYVSKLIVAQGGSITEEIVDGDGESNLIVWDQRTVDRRLDINNGKMTIVHDYYILKYHIGNQSVEFSKCNYQNPAGTFSIVLGEDKPALPTVCLEKVKEYFYELISCRNLNETQMFAIREMKCNVLEEQVRFKKPDIALIPSNHGVVCPIFRHKGLPESAPAILAYYNSVGLLDEECWIKATTGLVTKALKKLEFSVKVSSSTNYSKIAISNDKNVFYDFLLIDEIEKKTEGGFLQLTLHSTPFSKLDFSKFIL